MQIRYGLISCDSHGQLDKDAFTRRMSKAKWGDRIPQIVEVKDEKFSHPVNRWMVNGKVAGDSVCNCPAAMEGGVERGYYPQRWEEVPRKVYDPLERAKALDEDKVDGEVLYPNNPVSNFAFLQADAEYELACVQAYNDAITEWYEVTNRYIPLAIIPYMNNINVIVSEVERAVTKGHRGVIMLAQPGITKKGLKHFNDPFWEPLWSVCQDLDMPIHWHGSSGLASLLAVPRWKGFTRNQSHTVSTSRLCATPAQLIPNLILSGLLDKYPRLNWVCAETGLGWVNYVLEACDHEWERRHLWTAGILTRPSELFRRQIYVDFWYEKAGMELRHEVGIDKIMWESDYPHIASTYPKSWKFVEWALDGLEVTEGERKKLLYDNAVRLYKLS